MVTATRIILIVFLLVLAYGETGPWTTVILAWMAVTNELLAYWMRQANKVFKILGR